MLLNPHKLYKEKNMFLTETRLSIDDSKVFIDMSDEKIFPLF